MHQPQLVSFVGVHGVSYENFTGKRKRGAKKKETKSFLIDCGWYGSKSHPDNLRHKRLQHSLKA